MGPPVRIIINPAAGRGRARALARDVAVAFSARGANFDCVHTREPGHAEELADAFLQIEPAGIVVAVGGDGTVHEIVRALARNPGRGSLGFIAAGTGNDAGRTLSADGTIGAAVEAAMSGHSRPLDIGLFDAEPFLNGVGIGLDGETAARAMAIRWLRGTLSYAGAAIWTLASWENPRLRIEVDGEMAFDGSAMLCAVGNGPTCGGGFRLTPAAVPDDGLLDVCVLGDFGRLEALRSIPAAFSGGHVSFSKAHFFRGRRIELRADRPLLAHADGEIRRPSYPATYEVRPAAIRVLTSGPTEPHRIGA